MARPTKHNADYFSHDSNMRNNIKIRALRRRFSNEGYAIWCYILEVLTSCDFFELEYDALNQELLAADFDVPVETFRAIVDYCCEIDLLQLNEDKTKLFATT